MSTSDPGIKIAQLPPPAALLTRAGSCPGADTPGQVTDLSSRAIDLKWTVSIPHDNAPGVRVAVMFEGEDKFTVLANGVDAKAEQTNVVVPGDKSGAAVVQWMWASNEDGGFYLACADVRVPGAVPAGTVSGPAVDPEPAGAAPVGAVGGAVAVADSENIDASPVAPAPIADAVSAETAPVSGDGANVEDPAAAAQDAATNDVALDVAPEVPPPSAAPAAEALASLPAAAQAAAQQLSANIVTLVTALLGGAGAPASAATGTV